MPNFGWGRAGIIEKCGSEALKKMNKVDLGWAWTHWILGGQEWEVIIWQCPNN